MTPLHHSEAGTEVIDRVAPCEISQWANEAEARRQALMEIENFQPLGDKLFGYMNNDDLICIDVDATSARY
ncbi:MAG: hypothetical protein C5B55_13820 [Blastocatellia bacterium]|nr:MAG: hypothetical protein C5B55_13820 [Blastocatellia bacterium]